MCGCELVVDLYLFDDVCSLADMIFGVSGSGLICDIGSMCM